MEIKTFAKRWGSSIGVIIPKKIIESERIKENDELIIRVEKKPVLVRDIFGLAKGRIFSPTSEIKLEMKRSWDKKGKNE